MCVCENFIQFNLVNKLLQHSLKLQQKTLIYTAYIIFDMINPNYLGEKLFNLL